MGLVALGLAACSRPPVTVDTPMNGAKVSVGVGQEMLVNWPNMRPEDGSWQLERAPGSSALSPEERQVKAAAAGVQQLETFRFTGVSAGQERLTFVYRHKDGAVPGPDERITLAVEVG